MRILGEIYNFLQLSETIATSGQPTEKQLELISQAGYEVVLNLGLIDAEYSLKDEAGIVRDLGLKYVHIPVAWEDPKGEDYKDFVSVMEKYHEKMVFVHCAANMRVSVFIALYRILILGWEEDLAFVDVHRIWKPNAIWSAFIQKVLKEWGSIEADC
jgi:protein tyrosine phosphatase (PTP) superfamily phosphohydrolase (DUF442 family)